MALTKVITGVTDLNQAQSTNGLKFPTGDAFAGTPEEGMIRNDQSQSSETSSSTMQFYNGTAWKNFVNKVPCTTDNAAYPVTNTAYYKLDSNANDSSGNGYNGTASNVTYAAGKFDDAAVFNGTSSVISLGTSSPLNTFGGAQTISVWVKPSASRSAVIGYRNDSTLYWNFIEIMTNNSIRFLLRSGGTALVFNSVGTITLNQWNHIAITVDSTSAKIYINNGSPETASNSITSFSNTETTYIGYSLDVDATYFTGQIDQVRIFSSALNAAQVTQLYNEIQC